MSATPPRQRRRDRVVEAYSPGAAEDDAPGTPGPTRARINNLEGQVQELVRKLHAAERKVAVEGKEHDHAMEERNTDRALLRFQLERECLMSSSLRDDISRLKDRGAIMQDELRHHLVLQEQKAALALADGQLAEMETERTERVAAAERLKNDHSLLLFQSGEADLAAAGDDKDARIAELEEELESANTSMAHQRAAEDKAKALVEGDARTEVSDLQAKVAELEKENRSVKSKEKVARSELEALLSDKDKSGSADREKGELRSQLREAKKAAREQEQKAEELKEALDEYKERQEAKYARLKEKAKTLQVENERLAEVESELAELNSKPSATTAPKTKKAAAVPAPSPTASPSPAKPKPKSKPSAAAPKPRSRKTSPTESEEDAPKKKSKPEKKPLRETVSENLKSAVEDEPPAQDKLPADKKKKRRILGGAAPAAFTWDPIMNSGDGVIPTFLSPVRPGSKSVGTVPRAGFGSLGSRGR